jgi:hypothetical protein
MLHADYVLFPYKQLRYFRFEISAGLGFLMSKLDVSTSLTAYDALPNYNGSTPQVFSRQADFHENKTVYGGALNMNMNFFFGKRCSFALKIFRGMTQKMEIPERSITAGTVTTYVPAHTESLNGISASMGLSFHIIPNKKKPSK